MKKTMQVRSNPFLDGLEAKERANKAFSILNESFDKVQRVGAKQTFFIKNRGKSFFVQITSAPSNAKTVEAIKGASKQFGKFPYYIIYTRDANDYPDGSVKAYWGKLNALPKKLGKKFLGAIISLDELESLIPTMKKLNRITNDVKSFSIKSGNRLDLDVQLKAAAKLTPTQLKNVMITLKSLKVIK